MHPKEILPARGGGFGSNLESELKFRVDFGFGR